MGGSRKSAEIFALGPMSARAVIIYSRSAEVPLAVFIAAEALMDLIFI
jgi:hypothetical protein